MRVLAGVGAWMLGVGAATAGSLLAVSLLGQGIATSNNQQLTTAAVNRALAAEASDTPGPSPAVISAASPGPSGAHSFRAKESSTMRPQAGPSPSAQGRSSGPAASPGTQATADAGPASTVLTSPGGTVVAECRPGGAYLVSWSPDPGYESGTVIRGPVVTARVTFNSTVNSVTMMVSCSAGTPTASTSVGRAGGWSDDGGGDD